MSELKYQGHMIDWIKAEGGFGWKLANRFLVGVPDLFIKHPDYPVLVAEAKYAKFKKPPVTVKFPITPPQVRFMNNLHRAGCVTAGVTVVEYGPKHEFVGFRFDAWSRVEIPFEFFEVDKKTNRREAFSRAFHRFMRTQ